MPVRLRRALPLALTLSLASCIRLGGQPGLPGAEGPSVSTPNRGLMRKRVAAKEEPNLLLAHDGTSCPVTAERYRDVAVGEHVVCVWQ